VLDNTDDDAVIVQPETTQVSGYCDDYLRRLEKRGNFPARFKLNPDAGWKSRNGWSRREVQAWIASRRASRQVA
jgi:predicted DNA-binding transcriptional regulator AlpA